jgi:hypothetical protein
MSIQHSFRCKLCASESRPVPVKLKKISVNERQTDKVHENRQDSVPAHKKKPKGFSEMRKRRDSWRGLLPG